MEKLLSRDSGYQTFSYSVETPLICLSTDRTFSHAVVAGRGVFKIFGIDEAGGFHEKNNVRHGKNSCVSDVAWNPIEDHVIASAATNGNVVLWDLTKHVKPSQVTFQPHERTVHKVSFHNTEWHTLMSASQDGSMMLFDMRQKRVTTKFNTKSDSVRDVQFCPHHLYQFAAALDNGNVDIWDMRNPNRYDRCFTAHSSLVYTIDWHPDDKNWIATGGRDHFIKVWDLSKGNTAESVHTVRTICDVSHIKWRPTMPYQIASLAQMLDFTINMWDIKRPYIPFASFHEHKDVVTGLAWKPNDPNIFISGGKDSKMVHHYFKDAHRPIEHANPVGVDISIEGKVAFAASKTLLPTSATRSSNYSTSKQPIHFKKQTDRTEEFQKFTSMLSEMKIVNEELSMKPFVELAKLYQLSGDPIGEIFEKNAKVAHSAGKHQISQTWRILKLLFSDQGTNASQNGRYPKADLLYENDNDRSGWDSNEVNENEKEKHTTDYSEEESDAQENENERPYLGIEPSFMNHPDFWMEFDPGFEFDAIANIHDDQDEIGLPSEAFHVRHELADRTASPDPLLQQNSTEITHSPSETDLNKRTMNVGESNIMEELLGLPPFPSSTSHHDFTQFVCDMLYYYAEIGDVQTACSVLLILDDKISPYIDEMSQEQWLLSYIDLLGHFELWNVATKVINLSNIGNVYSLNQQSTFINTACGKCFKYFHIRHWKCLSCGNTSTCSICHLPVKGLYLWCQGCSHGGHLNHIKEWFAKSAQCPTGCGHHCEYT